MSLTLDGTTGISATGNITGNNVIASGTLTAGTFSPTSLSASGNVTGGNIITAGLISATGNITGSFILGNGSQLTGVDATQIVNGTSNAKVVSSGGNIAVGIGGTANVAVFASTGVFITGVNSVTANVTGGNILTAGLISATGNITGGNILGGANVNATTHTGTTVSVTANVTGGNILTAGLISATGAITGAALTGSSLTVSTGNVSCGNIVNTNANGVGNIGSASLFFNTVFAKATSAQYADLAEMYVADKQLDAGQVVEFGGIKEIQQTSTSHSTRVAGIVSTNPSYIMNATLNSTADHPHVVAVALTGRVPCFVVGKISKGDRLVSSDQRGVATVLDINQYQPGCIIGKALENYDSQNIGRIEVAVGRF